MNRKNNSILEKIGEGYGLPVLSPIALRLRELASSETSSIDDLTSLITKDPSLAARLLKLANGAFFGNAGQITTIEHAVMRVGFTRLRDMALAISLRDTFPIGKVGPMDYEKFWKSSLYRAIIAKGLTSTVGTCNPEEVFVAGLTLEIGLLIFFDLFIKGKVDSMPGPYPFETLLAWEQAQCGVNHREIGRQALRYWNFPEIILECQVACLNEKQQGSVPPLALICDAARRFSYLISEKGVGWHVTYTDIETRCGIKSQVLTPLLVSAFNEVQEISESLKVKICREGDLIELLEKANSYDDLEKEINEHRQAEIALQESEERFKLLVANVKDYAIFMLGPEGRVETWNAGAERMQGYKAEEIIGEHLSRFFTSEDITANKPEKELKTALEIGEAEEEVWHVRKDGSLFWASVTITALRDVDGMLRGFVKITRDITERRKAEEELHTVYGKLEMRVLERTLDLNRSNEQLRNLAAHLQSVREEERAKIAREIHDEFGQTLSALKMELSWFREKYGDHKAIFDKSGAMLDAVSKTIRSVRRMYTELRPSILDDFGIVDAMQWQADEFQKRTRIECAVDPVPEDIKLDKERSTALFRIFQETLTNVLKHARATKVTARLAINNDNITLEVIDNGKGITEEQLSKPQSFGLIGIRERVYPWGGKVEVTGNKNKGTIVKVSMPHLGCPPPKQSN